MTKGEWIDVIKNTMAKVDEQGIYRRPLIERHIQSVYEQMFNELYTQDKRSIWHYVRDYTLTLNTTTISDWYLPSLLELDEIHTNLHGQGDGGFVDSVYWSSSEFSDTSAYYVHFGTGDINDTAKTTAWNVRPIRTFTAASGAYALRDRGPAGGWIFYIDGTTYYEAAPEDLTSAAWSNVTDTEVTGTGTAIGTGEDNTALITGQDGHTASAAKDCEDSSVDATLYDMSSGVAMNTLPVSFNRRCGGVFNVSSTLSDVVLTDSQGYRSFTKALFDTIGMKDQYFAYVSGDKLYSNIAMSYGESVTYSIVPKFTSLSSTDEVLIPNGADDHFIDRIIDTIKHFRPTDLINDNTIQ